MEQSSVETHLIYGRTEVGKFFVLNCKLKSIRYIHVLHNGNGEKTLSCQKTGWNSNIYSFPVLSTVGSCS